jgi:hypothetical protein
MEELLRTHDLVFVSFVEALLAAEGIHAAVLDGHIAAAYLNMGAFPRRIMVDSDDAVRARKLLTEAGYGGELSEPE